MVKKWNDFIKESIDDENVVPGPEETGSARLEISNEEEEMFSSEPALENLISNGKVSLFDNEIWYFPSDTETMSVLKEYLPQIENEFVDDDEDDFEDKPLGWDEEFESVRESNKPTKEEIIKILKKELKDFEKDYDIEIKILPKGDKKESYKDKMKRLVTAAKEKANKKK